MIKFSSGTLRCEPPRALALEGTLIPAVLCCRDVGLETGRLPDDASEDGARARLLPPRARRELDRVIRVVGVGARDSTVMGACLLVAARVMGREGAGASDEVDTFVVGRCMGFSLARMAYERSSRSSTISSNEKRKLSSAVEMNVSNEENRTLRDNYLSQEVVRN